MNTFSIRILIFVQETLSDVKNEVEWEMHWRCDLYMSHRTNVSGGAAILFSKTINISKVSVNEIERSSSVQASINAFVCVFINIYTPNTAERIQIF